MGKDKASRRSMLQLTGAAAVMTPLSGLDGASAADDRASPLFRFGVVADPQYADAPPNLEFNRYFANSAGKLAAAIAEMNTLDLAFVVTLGDIIDHDFANFAPIMRVYETLRHPRHFLLGNHDYAVEPDALGRVPAALGMAQRYYDFAVAGHRFIVLDGNEVSTFAHPPGHALHRAAAQTLARLASHSAVNAHPWNGGVSDAQLAWLDRRLAAAEMADERVIVLNHYPVYPVHFLNLWNHEAVVERLVRSPAVVAHFNGHHHDGMYGETAGRHFVTFRGMVDTADETAWAIVSVFADRIEIDGRGREDSRTLRI